MVKWDPKDYARSSSAQATWAKEIIDRLGLRGDERILDIGCGDGKVTVEFLRHVPRGTVTGIDSSREMIAFAGETYPPGAYPGLSFRQMDACNLTLAGPFDLVFSSATLHWIQDRRAVLLEVGRVLARDGRMVITAGGTGNAGDFVIAIDEVTRRPEWQGYFSDFNAPYFFSAAGEFSSWVKEAGLTPIRIELVEKDMVHDTPALFEAWVRTTWMPYTHRIPEELRGAFVREGVALYLETHPLDEEGRTHVRMVRLEAEAVKE